MRINKLYLILALLISQSALGQVQYIITSKNIPAPDTVLVFTPQSYASNKTYPVVYMLHGYSSNYKQWNQIMDAQRYADEFQMIIVSPDGFFDSWYLNSPEKGKSQYLDFFFNDLCKKVEKEYSIDEKNRFITGLSMGGHGALHIFLQNPDYFNTAGSTSGIMNLSGIDGLFSINDHLGQLKGNENIWMSLSASGNISNLKEIGKEIIVDCGTEDPFYKWNKEFYELCLEERVPLTFISQVGKHDWDYWSKSIYAHYLFFRAHLKE